MSEKPKRTFESLYQENPVYSYKPTETVLAKFDGLNARCGKCNHKLGEFLKADGEIKCKCGVKNKVKI